MRNKSEVEKPAETPLLKCPNCDNCDPSEFQHWEEVTASRDVVGFNEDGALEINGSSQLGDEGDNERLVCLDCYVEFPVPSDLEIEWA